MNLNNKITPEAEFRKRILKFSEQYGCRMEIQQIMDRYDAMLLKCTNPKEREAIGTMGAVEIHKTLDCYGGLVVNSKLVIPATDSKKESENLLYQDNSQPLILS